MTDNVTTIKWLRGLAEKGGKGVVNNIDARSLGRIADELERLSEDYRSVTESWHVAKRNQFAAEERARQSSAESEIDRQKREFAEWEWNRSDERAKAAEARLAAVQKVLVEAGAMSNVCYNAKQNEKVPEAIRQWLASTQESFDKARDAYLAVVGSARIDP